MNFRAVKPGLWEFGKWSVQRTSANHSFQIVFRALRNTQVLGITNDRKEAERLCEADRQRELVKAFGFGQ